MSACKPGEMRGKKRILTQVVVVFFLPLFSHGTGICILTKTQGDTVNRLRLRAYFAVGVEAALTWIYLRLVVGEGTMELCLNFGLRNEYITRVVYAQLNILLFISGLYVKTLEESLSFV